jgi:hypothetical protein
MEITDKLTPVFQANICTNYNKLYLVASMRAVYCRGGATRNAIDRLDASLLNTRQVLLVVDVVKTLFGCLLLNSSHGDVSDSSIAIEDTGDFLEGRTLGLRVHEVHPDELNGNPALCLC